MTIEPTHCSDNWCRRRRGNHRARAFSASAPAAVAPDWAKPRSDSRKAMSASATPRQAQASAAGDSGGA